LQLPQHILRVHAGKLKKQCSVILIATKKTINTGIISVIIIVLGKETKQIPELQLVLFSRGLVSYLIGGRTVNISNIILSVPRFS